MSHAGRGQGASVTAFAPASVGNVAIGFDILGFSFDAIGDRATARWHDAAGVRIKAIRGVVQELPLDARRNTAGRALLAMQEALRLPRGFELELDKGIPLASGLGGSAASAVAAVVAANGLLDEPRSKLELLTYAMQGEAVASGSRHVDNIAPSLFGGLVLTVGIDQPRVKQIPIPAGIRLRLADRASGRLHLRLLHQRSRDAARVFRGRDHRASAGSADSRIRRGAARRARRRSHRLLDFGSRADGICLEPRAAHRCRARRHGAGVHARRPRE
jgi:hypothetical protein